MQMSKFKKIAAGAAVLLAAACNSDTTGPATLSNPQATAAAIGSLDSVFASAAFTSFATLSNNIPPAAALAAARSIVSATTPAPIRSGTLNEADATRRLSTLRQLALVNPQGPVIPDSLYGSIFTWDSALAGYTRSATTGGPTNGVRFILYAVNPVTATILYPLTPVGRTDLLDESAGSSAKLHVIVQGNGGTPTYLDYTAALTFGLNSVTADLSGTLTNALVGGANKTLTFSVHATITPSTAVLHATHTLNNPAVTIVLDVTDHLSQTLDSISVGFSFTRAGETVNFSGLIVITVASGVIDTETAAIKVNGQPYATVAGNAGTVTFYDHAGQPIQDTTQQHDILVALFAIRTAAIVVLGFDSALFAPILSLLGA